MISLPKTSIPRGFVEEILSSLSSNAYLFASQPKIFWAQNGAKIRSDSLNATKSAMNEEIYLCNTTAMIQIDLLDVLSDTPEQGHTDASPSEESDDAIMQEAGSDRELSYASSSDEEDDLNSYVERLHNIRNDARSYTRVWIAARLPGGYQPAGIQISSASTRITHTECLCTPSPCTNGKMTLYHFSLTDDVGTSQLSLQHSSPVSPEKLNEAVFSWRPVALRVSSAGEEPPTVSTDAPNLATSPDYEATNALVFPSLSAALEAVCPHISDLRNERLARSLSRVASRDIHDAS